MWGEVPGNFDIILDISHAPISSTTPHPLHDGPFSPNLPRQTNTNHADATDQVLAGACNPMVVRCRFTGTIQASALAMGATGVWIGTRFVYP